MKFDSVMLKPNCSLAKILHCCLFFFFGRARLVFLVRRILWLSQKRFMVKSHCFFGSPRFLLLKRLCFLPKRHVPSWSTVASARVMPNSELMNSAPGERRKVGAKAYPGLPQHLGSTNTFLWKAFGYRDTFNVNAGFWLCKFCRLFLKPPWWLAAPTLPKNMSHLDLDGFFLRRKVKNINASPTKPIIYFQPINSGSEMEFILVQW